MKILISGSHGFIGRALVLFIKSQGYEVVPLIRGPCQEEKEGVFWDPAAEQFSQADFEGFDAVIHLAGENIGKGRWTRKRKEEIVISRCRDTWLLSRILSELNSPPQVVVGASAIGFYGDREDEALTEASSKGRGFLAELVEHWEAAFSSVEAKGIRVVHARFGLVLSKDGGVLRQLLLPLKLGLGAQIGSGKQWVSWIALEDVVGAIEHALIHDFVEGVVNVVAPDPIQQSVFVRTLAKMLHRPCFLQVPQWLIRMCLGQKGVELLLSSARVKPAKLLMTGYNFSCPELTGLKLQ